MSTLNVYLADLPGAVRYPAPLRRTVQRFFDLAIQHSKFGNAVVQWTSRKPALAPSDLMVYFVEGPEDSVVKELTKNLGPSGTTYIGQQVASEVYLGGHGFTPTAETLGKLAIHELMHNVTKMGESLHRVPGVSIGKESISSETEPSSADTKLVGTRLGIRRRQWEKGFTIYNDPLR
ncbi:MAG: hypothetical protein DHS20C21_10350 [Gemmatimonadota bacterium]|nr:MAG: hypothetical protein DHS20C21_10350 [Gemmatimonadota bacterium]